MRPRTTLAISFAAFLVASVPHPVAAQFYEQRNIVSDGAIAADRVDPNLVNAWGLTASATSPWWISDNGTGMSTILRGTGAEARPPVVVPGSPTGTVFNGSSGFVITNGTISAPSVFLFVTEEGQIWGWNPTVLPSTEARLALDNSGSSAVYKGLTIATTTDGTFLYATNFRAGTVEMYDESFQPVGNGFQDPTLPPGYAPFGIQHIGGVIYVTYALQDDAKKDDVAGPGHGFINAFDTSGTLLRRVASRETLNSPWGIALAPDDFGAFSNKLLVGNFGDGAIHAFDPTKFRRDGEYQNRGPLHSADGRPIAIDGLWALRFGNGGAAGRSNVLFFTAGPFGEAHGLFGSLTPVTPQAKRPGRR
ncbi:MAG: TIGR03118 family protein [Bacteroidales bacterium]